MLTTRPGKEFYAVVEAEAVSRIQPNHFLQEFARLEPDKQARFWYGLELMLTNSTGIFPTEERLRKANLSENGAGPSHLQESISRNWQIGAYLFASLLEPDYDRENPDKPYNTLLRGYYFGMIEGLTLEKLSKAIRASKTPASHSGNGISSSPNSTLDGLSELVGVHIILTNAKMELGEPNIKGDQAGKRFALEKEISKQLAFINGKNRSQKLRIFLPKLPGNTPTEKPESPTNHLATLRPTYHSLSFAVRRKILKNLEAK